jgi:DNA repair protein RadD
MTSVAAFNYLIAQGFLSPLIPKQTKVLLDVTGVHKLGGEFKASELQAAVNKDEVTYAALQETVAQGEGRVCWLVFASGVDHAETITAMLNHLGVSARVVHSKQGDKVRDTNIADWKAGKFTAIVNNGILTTGVDCPMLDMIVMLRPTASTVLWVQMLGRGTRPVYAPGYDLTTTAGRLAAVEAGPKHNCLVLDFAGNTKRLGPINDPVLPRKKGEGTGEAPIRICDACGMYNHASARYCGGKPVVSNEGCGAEFAMSVKIKDRASTDDLIKTDHPVIQVFPVDTVTYAVHSKPGKPPSLRVSYYCGLKKFNEYIHFEMPGFLQRKAKEWWTARTDNAAMPETTTAAALWAPQLKVANRVRVWVNKPYPEIMAVSLDPAEEFN